MQEEAFDAVTLLKRSGRDGKHARRRQLNLIGGGVRSADPGLREAITNATKGGDVHGLFPKPAESGDPMLSLNKEEIVNEERERERRQKELQRLREREDKEEMDKTENYRKMSMRLENFAEEDVKKAKALVASIIKSGEDIEKRIIEAAEDDELTPLVLLVIHNRLELARHDDERHIVQALSLLFRRIEAEMMKREASPALRYLDELLNLYDGFRRDEWIRQCRQSMLKTFPPEDAFTVLAPQGFDLSSQTGPIDMPLNEDTFLLRVDFIREVDALLAEAERQAKRNSVEGLDPQSVAIRLSQQQKEKAIELVRELRKLALGLKW